VEASGTVGVASGSTALRTDHYELTMLDAAVRDGTAQRRCVFEVFARRLPDGRRYGVLAGTGRILDLLEDFVFGPAELAFLERAGIGSPQTLEHLAQWRFRGDIHAYGEGECYVPGSPLLVVEGTFADAVLLETVVLSVLNHDSAVAAAASRMTGVAGERPCIEMGTRRTHEESAVAAARAAYVAGFESTSNLEAGRRYGIPTRGTAAHAFTMLHDDEEAAFASQLAALGLGTTLLVDTYDVEAAVRTAVALAGPTLGAVRLDSGDLVVQAHEVRALLDSLGATATRIVVISDLDEFAIAALSAAPVDAYGVGTRLVTGSGAPAAGLVYKLVAREDATGVMQPVAKQSTGKPSHGGRKRAVRLLDERGTATAEAVVVVGSGDSSAGIDDLPGRALHVPLVLAGEVVGREPLTTTRARHVASRAELPRAALKLSHGDPVLDTVALRAT
jgi:nicotinate phosphoribosyltransferase